MKKSRMKYYIFISLFFILLFFILSVSSVTISATEIKNSENATPTLTITPQYPSVQDIEEGLSDEFNEIKELIIENKESASDSNVGEALRNIRDNIISSFIWDFFGNPIITSIFASLGIFAAAIRNNRKRNNQREGLNQNQEIIDRLLLVLMTFSFSYVAIFAILLLYVAAGQPVSQAYRISELRDLEERIERIENGVNYLTTRTATPAPTITATPKPTFTPTAYYPVNDHHDESSTRSIIQYIPLGISFILIIAFANIVAFYCRKRKIQLDNDSKDSINQNLFGLSNGDITAAILLILLLQILPYPADTLLLPFIVQFYISAFFDLVILYPNRYLKRIVTKWYSQFIFLAVFGTWLNFSYFVRNLLEPFWNLNRNLFYFGSINWAALLDFIWRLLPFYLAITATVPHWRYLRRLYEEKSIPKIIESLKVDNTNGMG